MEEYRALYRKYRPQSPADVLGQEHVVRALAGAVKEGRLAHAFLFSGPRGTGKTSSARILAKMVNCERGPTAEPCGVCEQCVRIREGTHLDVMEMDAASHGSVDHARELRERAPTAPVQGREKVYIVDEAQRLSREAFDALLKLLEEPPPGVRFVLATTEPHKMPPTIVGRTQRFEFRRIATETIAEQLQKVAAEESISLAAAAAESIARGSEGSLRDALSLLDQASVLGGGDVTEDVVVRLVGEPESEVLFGLADAVAVGDAKGVFGTIHRLVQDGHDLRHFATQVTGHFRDLLLANASPDDTAIIDVAPELHPRLVAQAAKFSIGELDRILALLLQAQTDLRWSTAPRLTIELALVRAAMPETDPQPAAVLARLERLERLAGLPPSGGARDVPDEVITQPGKETRGSPEEVVGNRREETRGSSEEVVAQRAGGERASPEAEPSGPTETAVADGAEEPSGSQAHPHAPTTSSVTAEMLRRSWPQVVEALRAKRRMIASANAEVATVGAFEDDVLELVCPPGREFAARKLEEKQSEVQEALAEVFGVSPKLRFTVRAGTVPEADLDEPPPTPEAAEELVRRQFGAEVVAPEE